MNSKTRKTLAREVLLFFSLLAIGLVIYLFLFAKNYIIEGSINNLKNQDFELKESLKGLEENLTFNFYNSIKNEMMFAFSNESDTLFIPNSEKDQFMLTHKSAIQLDFTKNPYFVDTLRTVRLERPKKLPLFIRYINLPELVSKVKIFYPVYSKMDDFELLERMDKNGIIELQDVKIRTFLYFLEFDRFIEWLDNIDYQNAVYKFITERDADIDSSTFQRIVDESYNSKKKMQFRADVENQSDEIWESILYRRSFLLDEDKFFPLILKVLIVLGILLYPVRLIILTVWWAIRTLRDE